MRYIPLLENRFLFHSLEAHGERNDGRRLFYFTLDEVLDNSRPVEMPTQEKLDEWQRVSNRLN